MAMARRPRMHRICTGKHPALTGRDLEIFRVLLRYRYLRSTYLHAFCGGASEKRFVERLGDLFHAGFIDRPPQQWQFADARCRPTVHEIGQAAKRVLQQQAPGDSRPRSFLAPAPHRQYAHALTICQCLASIELAAAIRPELRFVPWPEVLARAPEPTRTLPMPFRMGAGFPGAGSVVPDAFFGLEYRRGDKKEYRFFALEVDRGTMPVSRCNDNLTSYAAKLRSYRIIIEHGVPRSQLGIPNLFVLTVTTRPNHLASLIASEAACGMARFLFTAVEETELLRPAPDLLLRPWQRGALEPLTISEGKSPTSMPPALPGGHGA
jgi:hypothetical protein